MEKLPLHILLRYGDQNHPTGFTIQEHKKVLNESNSVWYGKFGCAVSNVQISKLQEQLGNVPTYLFLVSNRYEFHRCHIINFSFKEPTNENHLIPKYYYSESKIQDIKLWCKLSLIESMNKSYLNDFIVASSLNPISQSLSSSISSHFIIREKVQW